MRHVGGEDESDLATALGKTSQDGYAVDLAGTGRPCSYRVNNYDLVY